MNILFILHLYFPQHGAGGERMAHNIAKYLQSQGHQVKVLLTEASHYGIESMYDYDGITVIPLMKDITPAVAAADLIFTHLSPAALTIHLGKIYKTQVVFISHNTHYYDVVDSFPDHVSVLYNSNAMRDQLNYPNRSIVVHPPVDYRKWDFGQDPAEGIYITLVNVNSNKGGKLFIELARAMPERMFLGVGGSYDEQYREELPNLHYMDNTTDMESVYRKTRILLCPSKYESWGMAATEAMCNGIPVIYHPTFGLTENVGDAGIPIPDANPGYEDKELQGGESDGLDPKANLKPWIKAIKRLDDKNIYKKFVILARQRSQELDPLAELAELNKFVQGEFEDNRLLQDRELYAG